MSSTFGIMLQEKFPNKSIRIIEKLPKVAEESSEAWNNAGTGHSGFCELNYTPEDEKGNIDIEKAVKIAYSFHETMAFWKKCSELNIIQDIKKCIHTIPHISFVEGEENTVFLEKRWNLLKEHAFFKNMLFSKNNKEIHSWIPLVMEGRDNKTPIAATFIENGTDVNFGEITDQFINYLSNQKNISVYVNNEVIDFKKLESGRWLVEIKDLITKKEWHLIADFVFIGAGGGTLPLLEKTNIKEVSGYGGFPISGQWLKCNNREIIEKQNAKVYGKAKVGAPPMSVPHLDTRIINGKKELLFGPFAGFSTKFLKNGSYLDLPLSLETDNILPMLGAGINNIPLTKYLIEQVTQSMKSRINELKTFYPQANSNDWELVLAGQRVQVIKKDEKNLGRLEFGTEVIISEDKTIAGLLGASPGASISYSIMKEVLENCFNSKT